MDLVFGAVAFASMDAGAKPTGMYLRRATAANTEFMSGVIAMCRKHLLCLTLNNLTNKLMGRQWHIKRADLRNDYTDWITLAKLVDTRPQLPADNVGSAEQVWYINEYGPSTIKHQINAGGLYASGQLSLRRNPIRDKPAIV